MPSILNPEYSIIFYGADIYDTEAHKDVIKRVFYAVQCLVGEPSQDPSHVCAIHSCIMTFDDVNDVIPDFIPVSELTKENLEKWVNLYNNELQLIKDMLLQQLKDKQKNYRPYDFNLH